jgi:hypothetical protein
MTTPTAAFAPVERPLLVDAGDMLDEDGEDVAEGEVMMVELAEGCVIMVWLKGMRKLFCFLLD